MMIMMVVSIEFRYILLLLLLLPTPPPTFNPQSTVKSVPSRSHFPPPAMCMKCTFDALLFLLAIYSMRLRLLYRIPVILDLHCTVHKPSMCPVNRKILSITDLIYSLDRSWRVYPEKRDMEKQGGEVWVSGRE